MSALDSFTVALYLSYRESEPSSTCFLTTFSIVIESADLNMCVIRSLASSRSQGGQKFDPGNTYPSTYFTLIKHEEVCLELDGCAVAGDENNRNTL